jgi:hypothetical protein
MLRIQVCWDVTMCYQMSGSQHFRKCSSYDFKGPTIQEELQIVLLDPDYEGTMFLQYVGNNLPKDTT